MSWKHILGILFASVSALTGAVEPMTWPTPHPGPAQGASFEEWAQPTVSGDPVSGLFGCVRNDGGKFHEAIDIAPFQDRENGEATDPVFAAWSGTVVYVNESVKDSGYGRYVVVRHEQFAPAFVTLYAHLASVEATIRPGVVVRAGQSLGIMGRSAGGYRIPPERAHLHFEIALRLSDDFQSWYDSRGFGTPNTHGVWNGMNLIGLDPWAAWQWMRADVAERTIPQFIETLPVAFVAEIATSEIPDIVRRYPALLEAPLPANGVGGWRIAMAGWGMPLRFTPLEPEDIEDRSGTVRVVAVDPEQLDAWTCRRLASFRNGVAELEPRGQALFQLLFTFRSSPR